MHIRRLIIALLCVAGLAVVLDFGFAAYSEYRVSRLLRAGSDLSSDPEVTFHSSLRYPFATQALSGDFRNIDIRAREVRPDIPGKIVVEANLRGAELPFSSLVDRTVRAVPVDVVESRIRIEPNELGRLFKIPDLEVKNPDQPVFGPGKSDGFGGIGGVGGTGFQTTATIVLSGKIAVDSTSGNGALIADSRNGQLVSVLADMRLVGNQVHIAATDIYREPDPAASIPIATEVPELDKAKVLALFTRTIDTHGLSFGVRPAKVKAEGGQIVVEGREEKVTVDLDRLQQP
ncbi:LmeA family phospholipid-binding protein [Nocardia crassostreae]|uniref:LmeA family phospholipid-binding protein n=1 Tax=Nocardia crassostreae TaxID=53428 RepID=UPI0008305853|nr:LmeA family phospholipid-binding protein [Nocardia crassostreae]